MEPNPDEVYQAKAALEPVAPVTLWLYPQLQQVEGSMQRATLTVAKRKASQPWLYRLLVLCLLLVSALQVWARETDQPDILRIAADAQSVVFMAFLVFLIFQFLRTRRYLGLDVPPKRSDESDG